jgi:di/tricarboxylate transporter
MWLNIMSFILASMLVKTGLAKRFTLWFILRFGHSASHVFLSFIVINVVMSAFISATTAKAAILLPVFMVIAAIYGARPDNTGKTNFGRNIVLQQLLNINLGAGAFVTGSGANLLAAALISRRYRRWRVLRRLDDGHAADHGRADADRLRPRHEATFSLWRSARSCRRSRAAWRG